MLPPDLSEDLCSLQPHEDRLCVTVEIPLPAGDKEYHIVSRQDATALATPPSADGTITGRVKIADSARFWANSKYLIIVEG